jgi:uncharacterized membrane protein
VDDARAFLPFTPDTYNGSVQRVLAATLTIGAIAWSVGLFVAPYALTRGSPTVAAIAAAIYQVTGRICHQRPERSFHLSGVQLPVCARCTGLYASAAVGALVAWLASTRPRAPRRTRLLIVLAALPMALSVGFEFVGLVYSSNTLRAVSAVPLGAVAGWIFVQSLRAEAIAAGRSSAGSMRYDAKGI